MKNLLLLLLLFLLQNFSKGCDKLEKFRKLVCDKKQIRITVSIGVYSLNDEDINELIQKADNNLYKSEKRRKK